MHIRYICLIFSLMAINLAKSQSLIVVEPDEFNVFENELDISEKYYSMDFHSYMNNLSDDTVRVHWKRIIGDNCPDEWTIWMSDKNISYLPWVDSSAYPIQMLPNEEEAYYLVMVFPHKVPGCCDLKVIFTDAEDSSIVFDTINYSLRVNDENCGSTGNNTEQFTISNPMVFPNPFSNAISIKSEYDFDEIIIQNHSGLKLQSLPKEISNLYDLSALSDGIYFLHLMADDQVIGIEKIIKAATLK